MPSEDGTPRRRAENGEALSPKGKVFWVLWGQRVARPQRELCRLVSRKHGGCGGTSCFLWASGRVFPSRTFLSVQPQSSQQSVPLLIFYKGNAAPHDGIYVVHIRRGGGASCHSYPAGHTGVLAQPIRTSRSHECASIRLANGRSGREGSRQNTGRDSLSVREMEAAKGKTGRLPRPVSACKAARARAACAQTPHALGDAQAGRLTCNKVMM